MSLWTGDPGCGNACLATDMWQWRRRARLLESIAGDLGIGAFQQPRLLTLQTVLSEAGACVDCAEEVTNLRAAAAPLRDQVVSYAKAGVENNRQQGGTWPKPECLGPVCTIIDQTESALAYDVTADLVLGVQTPEPLDVPWPDMGVKPASDFVPLPGQYQEGLGTWLPTLSSFVRSARGGYQLAHDPADLDPQGVTKGGLGAVVMIGGLLWALTRKRR